MKTFIVHYTVDGQAKQQQFTTYTEQEARRNFAMYKHMREPSAVLTSVEEKTAPVVLDYPVTRQGIDLYGTVIHALDLIDANVDFDAARGTWLLQVKTTSKGLVVSSCAPDDEKMKSEFREKKQTVDILVQSANEYRRVQQSN